MRAAVLVTEFGGKNIDLTEKIVAEQDRHLASSTWWVWKQNGGGGWGLFDHSPAGDRIRADRVPVVSRVYPRATAGALLSFSYDPHTAAFSMAASCERGSPECTGAPTLIYVPAHVPSNASVQGEATLTHIESSPDGSRVLEVTPSARGGVYSVAMGDAIGKPTSAVPRDAEVDPLRDGWAGGLGELARALGRQGSPLSEALSLWMEVHAVSELYV